MICFAHKVVKISALWIAAVSVTLSVSGQPMARHQESRPALGTLVSVTFYSYETEDVDQLIDEFYDELDRLNLIFSDYDRNSEVGRINASKRRLTDWQLSEDLCDLLQKAEQMRALTPLIDPYIGRLTHLWKESFKRDRMPRRRRIGKALKRSGAKHVLLDTARCTLSTARKGVQLDLGGIAKGYIGDLLASWLKQRSIDRFLIDLGGDLIAGLGPPREPGWRIEMVSGKEVMLRNRSIATSGSSYQHIVHNGIRYNHLIDARSGWATSLDFSSTVQARYGWLADAGASAMPLLAPAARSQLARVFDMSYYVVVDGVESSESGN